MKLNIPLTPAQHAAADAQYKATAESQRRYIRELAEKIEKGEPLDGFGRGFAAAVLRGAAKGMKDKRPRPAGRPTKLPGELAVLFVILTEDRGLGTYAAVEKLAEDYGVSETAVKKALGLTGKEPEARREVAIWKMERNHSKLNKKRLCHS